MNKFFFFSVLIGMSLPAQNYGLREDFENEAVAQRWTTLDLDGDGKNWTLTPENPITAGLGFSGYTYISKSFDQTEAQPLNPDNVLVSPTFLYESPAIKDGNNYLLGISFKISASDQIKFAETYAVYLIPATETFTGTETPLFFETLDSGETSKTVFIEKFDWGYFGQQFKLYFRHYNSQNQNALIIDDITNYNFTAGTDEFTHKNKLVIFPNPATSKININLNNETVLNVEVLDISGKKFEVKEKNKIVNIKNLPPGVYFIKITTNRNSYLNRFIKQ